MRVLSCRVSSSGETLPVTLQHAVHHLLVHRRMRCNNIHSHPQSPNDSESSHIQYVTLQNARTCDLTTTTPQPQLQPSTSYITIIDSHTKPATDPQRRLAVRRGCAQGDDTARPSPPHGRGLGAACSSIWRSGAMRAQCAVRCACERLQRATPARYGI